jgi:hypothetical protein
MNKREMQLLEKAFIAEIEEGAHGTIGLLQTKSRLAEVLAEDGYLVKDKQTIGGRFPVVVQGYRLTHLGRLTYCIGSES